jgi:hypothetical protein
VAYAIFSATDPALRSDIVAFCRQVVSEQEAGRDRFARQHGYFKRVVAARAATAFLREQALNDGDGETHRWAVEQVEALDEEAARLVRQLSW